MRARRTISAWFTVCLSLATLSAAADRDLRLIDAAKRGDEPAVRALLAAGIDVNARAGDRSTALHWAASANSQAIADLLIQKGAAVNAATDLGITPLWIASTNSSTGIIASLLAAHADPNIAPATDGTPLMIAARRGNAEAVKNLLAHGANANAVEAAHAQTALMWAAAERHPDAVRLLLDAGADVRARSTSSTRRVIMCCQFFEGDADGIDEVVEGGFTALLFAAQEGDTESARLLLAAGADVNDVAPVGTSAVVVAAHAGQGPTAAFLLEKGANPDAAGAGYAALHVAATTGDLDLVRALLAHGANPNVRQMKGSPTKRLRSGHALDRTMIGATPYVLAARAGQLEVMRVLAAHKADTSATLVDGRNALMVVAGRGTDQGPRVPESRAVETIALAISLGTPVNQASLSGDTALHVAATRRRDAVLQALVDHGAALNARNAKGETPLTAALTPPPPAKGAGQAVFDDYDFLLTHTATAELLRKLGATN